jgi:hypothetical protein
MAVSWRGVRPGKVLSLVSLVVCLAACRESPTPAPTPSIDAGPRVGEVVDCRTHLANLATGEVVAKAPPFAAVTLEGGAVVLREGGVESFRTPLFDGGAAPAGDLGAGAVLAHKVVALAGQRVHVLERSTGAVAYTIPAEGARSVLALPGDIVLVGWPERVVGYAAKTGREVFRVPTRGAFAPPELADEKLVVLRSTSEEKLVIVDPPRAKGTVAAPSDARRELPVRGLAVFAARAVPGDLFVVTPKELLHVAHGAEGALSGAVAGRAEVPFGAARAVTVLDTEDLVALAAFDPLAPTDVALVVLRARGESLREAYRLVVKAHPEARACTPKVALGKPSSELVIAVACGARSLVVTVDAATGAPRRRVEQAAPSSPTP